MKSKKFSAEARKWRPLPVCVAVSMALGTPMTAFAVLPGDGHPAGVFPAARVGTVIQNAPTRLQERPVVIVDPSVEDYQKLVTGIDADIFLLDMERPALEQITAIVGRYEQLSSLHIVSHGHRGELYLAGQVLSEKQLRKQRETLAAWAGHLSVDADILLYGCEVADGRKGRRFVRTLAELTGADVAASDDRSGISKNGADWELEIRTGVINSPLALAAEGLRQYPHTLATIPVSSNADSGAGTLRAAIASASSGDTISFDSAMTVGLTSGELVINKNLIIDGDLNDDGTPDVTLDPNYSSRVLNVTAGTVTLDGLVITKGLVSGMGGNGNTTIGTPGGDALGGGIRNAGTLTIQNSTVSANKAAGGGGGGYSYGGGGGGGTSLIGGANGGIGFGTGSLGGSGAEGGGGGGGGYGTGTYTGPQPVGGDGAAGVGGTGGQSYTGVVSAGSGGSQAAGGIAGIGTYGGGNGGTGGYFSGGGIGGGGGAGAYGNSAGYLSNPGNGGAGGAGVGGIHNIGTLTILSTTLSNNIGVGGGGGGGGTTVGKTSNGGDGGIGVGAIYNDGGTLNYNASVTFTGNGGGGGGGGGGSPAGSPGAGASSIHNNGGTVDNNYSPDSTPPTISSIVRQTPATATTNADSVTFRITFDEGVQNVDTADFTLSGTAAGDGTVNSVTPVSSSVYDVTITGLTSSNGTVNLDIAGGHNIQDLAANALVSTTPTGADETYTLDNIAPSAPGTPDMTAGTDLGSSNTDDLTSDTTPTFTGTAEANSTVTLISSVDGTVGSATADGSGNWTITASALSTGAHNMTATATDSAGNTGTASGALAITIDTTAPAAPSTPDLSAASDTGSSNTDDITADNTATLTGTAEANSAVTLISSVDGTVGSTTADGAGNWSITTSVLSGGAHNMTAVAGDAAGNVSTASGALAITIDTTAPAAPSTPDLSTASDTGSSNTDDITGDSTPTITGTAEANSTVTLTSSVDGIVGSATADGAGNWSITTSALSEGAHNLSATVTDPAGNTGTASSALAVTIDTTAPAAPSTPDMTAGTDLGSSNTDNITSTNTPTFSGTAEANSTVTLISSVDGTVGSATADGAGNWSITASALSAGAHNISATVTDTAGNTGTASGALAITIDTTAPAAPSTPDLSAVSDTGSSSTDDITGDTTSTMTGTAEANSAVTLISSVDGTVGSTTADGAGNWSITSSVLSEGAHNMTAVTSDTAGNVSTASGALAITVDTIAPAVPSTPDLDTASDTGSSNTDNITGDTTPTITGTAEANSTVTLSSSVDGVVGSTTADGAGNWSITTGVLSQGAHNLSATAGDTAGNASAASTALAVNIDSTAPAAPGTPDLSAASDSGSSGTDNITSDTTPTMTGTAEADSTVTLSSSVDGVVGSTSADGAGNWSITTSALSEGAHNLSATATDAAGNTGTASTALAVSIDTTAPATPAAPDLAAGSDSGSSNTDNITNVTTPTFTGTAEADSTVTLTSSVDGVVGTTTANGAGNWSLSSSALSAATHNLTISATDAAGNAGGASAALGVTVDTTAATLSAVDLIAASDSGSSNTDNTTNDTTPTITYTAENGSTVAIDWGDGNGYQGVVSGNGAVQQATLGTPYASDGNKTLTVRATDTAGNSTTNALVVSIDTTAPGSATGTLAINENANTGTVVGTVSAGGADSYSLTNNAGGRFAINANSGQVTYLTGELNYEAATSHNITVQATDLAGNSGSTGMTVTVNNVNEAPVISGTPGVLAVAGQAYSFVPGASDPDAGTTLQFSIQNKPAWAGFNTGTGELSGTPVQGDVGTTNNIIISVSDGSLSDSLSGFDLQVDGDLDGDGTRDSIDPDIDGDGMSNNFENTHGLDPWDDSDAAEDLDGDGLTNLEEYNQGKNPTLDDNPPQLSIPADISMDATALFTPVELGDGSAWDAIDGDVAISHDADNLYLRSGRYEVIWSAVDAAGNRAEASQWVDIRPLAGFGRSQQVGEDNAVSVPVYLNGEAPSYPVTIPYTLGGSAGAADHDLGAVSLAINSGNQGQVIFNTLADGQNEGVETLRFTMQTPTQAALGWPTEHTVSIHDGNLPPQVSLIAKQGGVRITQADPNGGLVEIEAVVNDPNVGDVHSYDWSGTDNALVDIDAQADTFSLQPGGAGLYTVRVSVSDTQQSTMAELQLKIMGSSITLYAGIDSDGDGVDDATEGTGDSNGNGIPDYLDGLDAVNLLPGQGGNKDSHIIETEPGLHITLGTVARSGRSDSANVSDEQARLSAGSVNPDDTGYRHVGGVFEFVLEGVGIGGSAKVVLPLSEAVPDKGNPRYRKLMAHGWQWFEVSGEDQVYSAQGEEGYCPSPGSHEYTEGLSAGHWCVQLQLTDGGPNDADNQLDGRIVDPGAVSVAAAITATAGGGLVDPPASALTSVSHSKGGALMWLLGLLGLAGLRRWLQNRC